MSCCSAGTIVCSKRGTGMSRFRRIGFRAIFLPLAAHAQPEYVPSEQATGTLRVWGSAQMQEQSKLALAK
jgi:hypothetical protein